MRPDPATTSSCHRTNEAEWTLAAAEMASHTSAYFWDPSCQRRKMLEIEVRRWRNGNGADWKRKWGTVCLKLLGLSIWVSGPFGPQGFTLIKVGFYTENFVYF